MELEFLDFELRIGRGAGGANEVVVIDSPTGNASAMMHLALDDETLQQRLQAVQLEVARGADLETRKGTDSQRDLTLGHDPAEELSQAVHSLGMELFRALLSSKVGQRYYSSLDTAKAEGKGLRLRLRVGDSRCAAIPWEYLYDEEARRFVCLNRQTPLARYLEVDHPTTPLATPPPLRILGMVASPTGLLQLDVELEKLRMAEAIEHLQLAGAVSLTWLDGQTVRDLQREMRQGPWHVFHFIGHGAFDESMREGQIALADDQGQLALLSATQLRDVLGGHPSLRLVVLNSCEGARASATDLLSSTATVLAKGGIPAVISMQYEISDRAALEFSREFYTTLAEGWSVEAAVTEARIMINNTTRNNFEWGTPVLHIRADDGHLFDINDRQAIYPESESSTEPEVQPQTAEAATPAVLAPTDTQAGLQILLRKVKRFWVEGVLENSLRHSGLIDLSMETLPEMVDSPWGSTPLALDQPVATICDELGGSFLILGVPGAGKTTVMLALVRELVSRCEQAPSQRIPVVSNLTSWTDPTCSIFDWLAKELSAKYQIPKKIGRSWIAEQRLQVFLDGLDEVRADLRQACVDAINTFTNVHLLSVVVCCRFDEYVELPVKLALNGAIRLRSLSVEQVATHLSSPLGRFDVLRELLKRDSSLRVLAQTPFMLSLMIRTYRDLPHSALDSGQFTTIKERSRELLDAYVQRQFRMLSPGGTHG